MFGGLTVYCDHRNLAYIFNPNTTEVLPSKVARQRLQGCSSCLGQFSYVIVHLTGEENLWVDLLSRLITMPTCSPTLSATVCTVQLFDGAEADMPSKNTVRTCQEAAAGAAREIRTPG